MNIKLDLLNKALNIFHASSLYKNFDASHQLDIIKEIYIGLIKIYKIEKID